jgi:hypothetical protein
MLKLHPCPHKTWHIFSQITHIFTIHVKSINSFNYLTKHITYKTQLLSFGKVDALKRSVEPTIERRRDPQLEKKMQLHRTGAYFINFALSKPRGRVVSVKNPNTYSQNPNDKSVVP